MQLGRCPKANISRFSTDDVGMQRPVLMRTPIYLWNVLRLRDIPRIAIAFGLILGLCGTRSGIFHHCGHAPHVAVDPGTGPTVQPDCPICDVLPPMFERAPLPILAQLEEDAGEQGPVRELALRCIDPAELQSRGPPGTPGSGC